MSDDADHTLAAPGDNDVTGSAGANGSTGADPTGVDRRSAFTISGQARLRELREQGWKPVRLNPIQQHQANPGSMKKAIKAMCWICVGADADPGAKFRVRDCDTGPKCPIYAFRPWQNCKGRIALNADGVLEGTADSEDTGEDAGDDE